MKYNKLLKKQMVDIRSDGHEETGATAEQWLVGFSFSPKTDID